MGFGGEMNLCVGLSGVIVGGNPIMVLQADSAVAVVGFQCGLVVRWVSVAIWFCCGQWSLEATSTR